VLLGALILGGCGDTAGGGSEFSRDFEKPKGSEATKVEVERPYAARHAHESISVKDLVKKPKARR